MSRPRTSRGRRTAPLLTAFLALTMSLGGAAAAHAATPTPSASTTPTATASPTPAPTATGTPAPTAAPADTAPTPDGAPSPDAAPSPADAPAPPAGDVTGTEPTATVMAAAAALEGNIDALEVYGTRVSIRGWAVDPSLVGDPRVVAVVDDEWPTDEQIDARSVPTDGYRTDVAWYYPGSGPWHGFADSVVVTPGTHEICVYAYTEDAASPIGCRVVQAWAIAPVGHLESVSASGSTVSLSGWAVDTDRVGPYEVHLYVDGRWGGAVRTTGVRTDIIRAYPWTGDQHGFAHSFTAGPGTHQVCAYVMDLAGDASPIGCRSVTVANLRPLANFESLTVSGTTVTLAGWALDPDTAGPIDVHVYVDGAWGGSLRTTGVRADVARAYPGTGEQHGFTRSFTAGPGTHQVCVYAIDTAGGAATPAGCRTVSVPAAPPNRLPIGNFEWLNVSERTVLLAGWALDPDVVGPIDVHLYVNGSWGGAVRTTVNRSDVAAAYPGTGVEHGFTRSFTAGPGTHRICAYAIDPVNGASNLLGCKSVTVG